MPKSREGGPSPKETGQNKEDEAKEDEKERKEKINKIGKVEFLLNENDGEKNEKEDQKIKINFEYDKDGNIIGLKRRGSLKINPERFLLAKDWNKKIPDGALLSDEEKKIEQENKQFGKYLFLGLRRFGVENRIKNTAEKIGTYVAVFKVLKERGQDNTPEGKNLENSILFSLNEIKRISPDILKEEVDDPSSLMSEFNVAEVED